MENVYANFDGLDLSLHGKLPDHILEALEAAKTVAAEAREPAPCQIGDMTVMVCETGRRGGYAYVFDTGEDGEVWAVMGTNQPEGRWMLHVSVKSAAFVQYGGLKAIRDRLSDRLAHMEFQPTRCPKSSLFESVGRVDFAMDFWADDFVLEPENIVSKGNKSGYFEGATSHWAGRRVTGCTVGKMPNRQVVIYDKTADIAAKRKDYWWQVWGLEPDKDTRIWRVELRAGKRFLAEVWKLRTLDDLADAVGDLMADTLEKVRYVLPTDSNVTRCPDAPLWRRAAEVLRKGLHDAFAGLCPDAVRETIRGRFDTTMRQLVRGVALTFAAVRTGGKNLAELKGQMEWIAAEVIREIENDPEETLKAAGRAVDRYRLLEEEQWQKRRNRPLSAWLRGCAT